MRSRKHERRKSSASRVKLRPADQPDLPPVEPVIAAPPVVTPPPRAVVRRGRQSDVAVGIRPMWARIGLVVLAGMYYLALLHHPVEIHWLAPAEFFTEATALFPRASEYALEYRLEGWSCSASAWQPLDPRPYFPIQPDDKESRFQRLAHFYGELTPANRPVMVALADYIIAGHAAGADDGIAGKIGGIQMVVVLRKVPAVGTPIERYTYDPLGPIPPDQRKDKYHTTMTERKRRCSS